MSQESQDRKTPLCGIPLRSGGVLQKGEQIATTILRVPVAGIAPAEPTSEHVVATPGLAILHTCGEWMAQQLEGVFFLRKISATFPRYLRVGDPVTVTFTLKEALSGTRGTFATLILVCTDARDPQKIVAQAECKLFRAPQRISRG